MRANVDARALFGIDALGVLAASDGGTHHKAEAAAHLRRFVCPQRAPALSHCKTKTAPGGSGRVLEAGVCLSVSSLVACLAGENDARVASSPACAVYTILRSYANQQTRNGLGVGDLLPGGVGRGDAAAVLAAAHASVRVRRRNTERAEDECVPFLAYDPNTCIPLAVLVPLDTNPVVRVLAINHSRRLQDAAAIVSCAVRAEVHKGNSEGGDGAGGRLDQLEVFAAAEGGQGSACTAVHSLTRTTDALTGRTFANAAEAFDAAVLQLYEDVSEYTLPEDVSSSPSPSPHVSTERSAQADEFCAASSYTSRTYRITAIMSCVYELLMKLLCPMGEGAEAQSGAGGVDSCRPLAHERVLRQHTQHEYTTTYRAEAGSGESGPGSAHRSVGRGCIHRPAASTLASGAARYTMDLGVHEGELHAFVVTARIAKGRLLGVDWGDAARVPGFVAFVGAHDVPGSNRVGNIVPDEELFATSHILFYGQTIGVVVARSERVARVCASLVHVQCEREPAVLTIDEAVRSGLFQGDVLETGCGDVEAALGECDVTCTGSVRTPMQSHIYLECNSAVAVPSEQDEMTVYSATQSPARTQEFVASVLRVPANRINCVVRRIGGGFGGKESRGLCLASMAAVAAAKVGRPVRLVLDRQTDMETSGKRHSFLGNYRVGFSREGKIQALDLDIYSNGGYSVDLSVAVLERCVLSCDNAYRIPNMRVRGRICCTNLPTNTAFRGFGSPEAHMILETVVERVALLVQRDAHAVRALNFYREGDATYFGQVRENYPAERLFRQLLCTSAYERRAQEVAAFNATHEHRKRGIAILPMCYGLSSTCSFMNQANALVHVYTDGSVLVHHGAVEMGQLVDVKMAQIAADVLGVPLECVRVGAKATDVIANNPPTVASVGADHNGMAVMRACTEIAARLKPLRAAHPEMAWAEVCMKAWMDKVCLSARGFYASPANGYDWEGREPKGVVFNYYTNGVSCTEVEVDCLSGHVEVLRADILMDVGRSLNPAIDVAQVEGGYLQGVGWVTSEEIIVADEEHGFAPEHHLHGRLLSNNVHRYLIPTIADMPLDLRISLLKNAPNPRPTVFRSKGVGEPPFTLALSAYFAIRNALMAKAPPPPSSCVLPLSAPATCERIRLVCRDPILALVEERARGKRNAQGGEAPHEDDCIPFNFAATY
eukprot:TRINITY_DN9057_c0_g1_i2.p1 TRINITY_DN9057_c0_g1~~TRINITY_DN9057_c0_g1_i2.p1  ORF type:complete len:1174 (+),score=239.67 TRINITY_DN9057_c0_g1_i2:1007-4528(+)